MLITSCSLAYYRIDAVVAAVAGQGADLYIGHKIEERFAKKKGK